MRLASCSILPIVVHLLQLAIYTECHSRWSPSSGTSLEPTHRTNAHATKSAHALAPLASSAQASDRKGAAGASSWWARRRVRLSRHRLGRARAADRRIFFSFNQLLLSLIAPRLMRYQFDLMMHSVVSELFKKILVPVVGSASGAGDSSSLFSSIGNLLRFRGQTSPRTTTAAPTVDVQRLLDNAHKLIALQSALRNPSTSKSSNPISQQRSANGTVNQEPSKHRDHSMTDTQIGRQNSSQSKPNTNTDYPIQLAISTKDFINFLHNNLPSKQANYNSSIDSTSAKGSTALQMETSSNINHLMHGTSSGHHFASEAKAAPLDHSLKKSPGHRMRVDDFKVSHLTFIDTEVPNYGNQLLVQDDPSPTGEAEPGSVDPIKSQLGLIEHSFLGEKEGASLKEDDLERANRWNDVLVNMNGLGKAPSG